MLQHVDQEQEHDLYPSRFMDSGLGMGRLIDIDVSLHGGSSFAWTFFMEDDTHLKKTNFEKKNV